MSFYRLESKIQRSKSMGALDAIDPKCVDSKILNFFANYSSSIDHKDSSTGLERLLDSVNNSHRQILDLRQENQKLKGVVEQLQNILKLIKEDTKISYRRLITNLLQESMKTMDEIEQKFEDKDHSEKSTNKQARILLAAIAPKRPRPDEDILEDRVRDTPTADSGKRLENVLMSSWESSFPWERFEAPRKWWDFTEKVPERNEPFKRSSLFSGPVEPSELNPLSLETEYKYAEEPKLPPSPPQPADPGVSVIDHLMQSAVINKKISEGDFNGAFEEALSHCNLALVMGACRAVDPAKVFNPCCLTQSVLLSLVQQLATDMVHETQLKCRYFEEALINLDVSNQVTRAYLPLVVGEVRKHLSKFLHIYPHHVANRRVTLIIMAADNLIK